DADLVPGNIRSGTTIFNVTGSSIGASGTATPDQVLSGASFSNEGGAATGSMPNIGQQNITPGLNAQGISAGYHDGSGSVAGDADLVPGNIRSGTTIFGVAGDTNVVNTGSGDAAATDLLAAKHAWVDGVEVIGIRNPAVLSKTGQTLCYDPACTVRPCPTVDCAGTGQDAEFQKGMSATPRFTDNGDGTVTDNLTGLIWLKDGGCTVFFAGDATGQNKRVWEQALVAANQLASGYCSLADGSVAGDWRLPNIRELQSLVDYSRANPSLPVGHPFLNTAISSNYYWTSTTGSVYTDAAWAMSFSGGHDTGDPKTYTNWVRPVRGGL
ncbi:MAG: DUF1566 domain-containing protein, partial [Desulfobulbus sp.]